MNLNDYIIDHSDFDWPELLSSWCWLLPGKFTVWLMNRIGDLFVITNDRTVHMLDVGKGAFEQIALNKDKFCTMMDAPDFASNKLAIPIVDSLVHAGFVLSRGECYSYKMLPIFGGKYSVDNFVVKSVAYHFAAFGPLHENVEGLPDGSRVTFKILN